MKKIWIFFFLVSLFATQQLCAQDKIKVITFNIRSFEPDFDVAPYAELLRSEEADIICLNEVENRSSRQQRNGKFRDVVAELAQKLNMFGLFGYSYNLANKKGEYPEENYRYSFNELYGNAILSRYPILNSNCLQLPRPKGSADQRGVVYADILLPTKKMFRIASTHLDHMGGQLEQAEVLVSDKVYTSSIPMILTGDMNQGPGSSVINKIETAFERMDNDNGTYLGLSKIDFIFGSKGKWTFESCRVLDRFLNGKELSDHCPVVSVVKMK